jgi:hypothetical protein
MEPDDKKCPQQSSSHIIRTKNWDKQVDLHERGMKNLKFNIHGRCFRGEEAVIRIPSSSTAY